MVRLLAVLGAVATLATVGGGLALGELAGGRHLAAGGPTTLALSVGLFGALILWVRPRNRIGALLLVTGVGFGIGVLASGVLDYGARRGGVPAGLEQASFAGIWMTAALNVTWALLILWFPDGTFPSRGWRRYFVAGSIVNIALAVVCYLFGPGLVYDFFSGTQVPLGVHGPFASESWRHVVKLGDLILLFPLGALAGLAQRYRSSTAVVREQIKWLIIPAAAGILLQLAGLPLYGHGSTAWAIGAVLSILGQPVTVLGATVGILRFRLWEIEIAVSRALVYGVLWAALTAVLLVPALVAGLLVGGPGALAAVVLALVVTVVFQPARTRLERLAERVVYRHRGRPQVLLAGFWELLRMPTTPVELAPLVAEEVQSTLGVEWCRLRRADELACSPATRERLRDSAGLVLAGEPPAELLPLWPSAPAAVVPLVGGRELVGVLACGPRPREPLGPADFEVLELIARECAMRLRNLGLEAQLRRRLREIEAQADELRRSRQRLVSAQDEERRRIERDLHDGVQQQLVALAVRLQHASADAVPERARLLADLAAEAEQSVFALQELARGIFPSVLADQGLAAALRTHVARVPLSVRFEADDELAGAHLDPELEAALYFIALEGLANAQKHAPGSAVAVRLSYVNDRVELAVADDGPGFEGADPAGTGLQNMTDRMAAIGGSFEVQSTTGLGTVVRASAPVALARQPVEADSRR